METKIEKNIGSPHFRKSKDSHLSRHRTVRVSSGIPLRTAVVSELARAEQPIINAPTSSDFSKTRSKIMELHEILDEIGLSLFVGEIDENKSWSAFRSAKEVEESEEPNNTMSDILLADLLIQAIRKAKRLGSYVSNVKAESRTLWEKKLQLKEKEIKRQTLMIRSLQIEKDELTSLSKLLTNTGSKSVNVSSDVSNTMQTIINEAGDNHLNSTMVKAMAALIDKERAVS